MQILFLQDYNFLANPGGGAELSDGLIFAYGLEIGHNVNLMTPEQATLDNIEAYDCLIVSNATRFKAEFLFEAMSRAKKTVFYAHDFWDICKWRLYKNNRETCRTKCPRINTFGKQFWGNVDGAVWLSSKHRESYLFSMPELESYPYILMPSPIDITQFDIKEEIKRVPNTVIGNNILPFKGAKEILKYCRAHQEYTFNFIGAEPENISEFPSNVNFVGRVNHKDVPRLLMSHQYAIELPTTVQPFERFPCEAALAGCELIINDNVGCSSYPWFQDYEQMKKEVWTAPKKFWTFIEG